MMEIEGRILNGIGGFYYVETEKGIVECHARGSFRKKGISPVAGDLVRISTDDDKVGTLESIEERKNCLVRPPVANVDYMVMVISMVQPSPNLQIVDTMLAVAESKEIEPIVVINKSDLADAEEIRKLYDTAGYTTLVVSAATGTGIEKLRKTLEGKVCVFTGNTGAGKSSILNLLDPNLTIETGETSQKLGRGRHTTRMSVLYPQPGGGYYIDTPGFSSLDLEKLADICPEDLGFCFREFEPYWGKCKFTSCAHTGEKGCAICEAVSEGKIAVSRHESYKTLLEVSKKISENYD